MIGGILSSIFGSKHQRFIKKCLPVVQIVNRYFEEYQSLSEEVLKGKTAEFRDRLAKGETLDQLLPEAFAVAKEACRRFKGKSWNVAGRPTTWDMVPYDVQLIGGMVLHQGKIAEMATGEGKTLVATLPAYLNALPGKGVHIVTVNDYLASRDRAWMGPIFEMLGLTVGVIQNNMDNPERKAAYACDITYGTNNEFGFDYLRDNMKVRFDSQVQRGYFYAVVDEVDSILIDEARTPLIISGPAEESTDKYYVAERTAKQLKKDTDYAVKEKENSVILTDAGIEKAQKLVGVDTFYTGQNMEWPHHIEQALRAKELYRKDKDYIVKDNEVIIVDEFTGRLMPGRRWSDGLHQAVEAKEGIKIERENQTLATITFQNYFRLYEKLSGMTGTAYTEAVEFKQIYELDCVVLPTNKKVMRKNHADCIYRSLREKFKGITIATNMAGRGTDIVLGGNAQYLADNIVESELARSEDEDKALVERMLREKFIEQFRVQCQQENKKVIEQGGLHVLGTERHESRRIDNQLRGRQGRQGDPGSSRFYVSLEDDLMRLFASDKVISIMDSLGMEEGQVLEHPWLSKSIETAQKRVETHNFEIRKHLLEYDNVMNKQREVVYDLRRSILEKNNVKDIIVEHINSLVEDLISQYLRPTGEDATWNMDGLKMTLKTKFDYDLEISEKQIGESNESYVKDKVFKGLIDIYRTKEDQVGPEHLRYLEKMLLLHTIDSKWKDHLYAMDQLKEGIGLRSFAQRDPLIDYKREGFEMFHIMYDSIGFEVAETIFKIQPAKVSHPMRGVFSSLPQQMIHDSASGLANAASRYRPEAVGAGIDQIVPPQPSSVGLGKGQKIGRNDPCTCGSGKKYK